MLNPDEIRLCGSLVRRAGYHVDDIAIQLGVEDVRAGKESSQPWHQLLASIMDNIYNARKADA